MQIYFELFRCIIKFKGESQFFLGVDLDLHYLGFRVTDQYIFSIYKNLNTEISLVIILQV